MQHVGILVCELLHKPFHDLHIPPGTTAFMDNGNAEAAKRRIKRLQQVHPPLMHVHAPTLVSTSGSKSKQQTYYGLEPPIQHRQEAIRTAAATTIQGTMATATTK